MQDNVYDVLLERGLFFHRLLCYRFCILRVGIFFLVHQFRQISNVILTGKLRLSPKQHALWTPVGIPVPVRELHLFHTDQILCEPRLRRDVIFKPNPGNSGKRDDQAQHCPQSNADILQPLPFPGSSPLVPYFPVQPDGYSQIYIKQEKQQTQQNPPCSDTYRQSISQQVKASGGTLFDIPDWKEWWNRCSRYMNIKRR